MLKKLIAGLIGLAAVFAALVAVYEFLLRPRHLRWGSTDEEVDLQLPGDELVEDPKLQATHAVTIHAPPSQVWPWLVQIGQGRGGFYSYDFIENAMGLDIHSTYRILPEHQDLNAGDLIPLSPDGFGLRVGIIEAGKNLVLFGDSRQEESGSGPVLQPGDYMAASWGFYLFDTGDGSTRLVERIRIDWKEAPQNTFFYRVFLEPGSFVMERKMLLGVKERAETRAMNIPVSEPA
jgi:hypothetical protein